MSTVTLKCPSCGAPLQFSADTQSWNCHYCLSSFDKTEVGQIDKQILKEKDTSSEHFNSSNTGTEGNVKSYSCSNCGAEIVTDETTAATFCYYCHSPAVIPSQLSGEYKPARIIPFKFERKAVLEIFKKWCKKKPLLSGKFLSSAQLDFISGVYIPFWLFDCKAEGQMNATGKNIRKWVNGDTEYTETKHYDIYRRADAFFSKIPADGSQKIDDKLMEVLEPFDYKDMEAFSSAFLSGYLAQRFDQDHTKVYDRVTDRVKDYTQKLINETISGYSSINVESFNAVVNNTETELVLLPVWMLTHNHKGKTYAFAMNGQTGKIAGNLPISIPRLLGWFTLVSAIVLAILLGGDMLL